MKTHKIPVVHMKRKNIFIVPLLTFFLSDLSAGITSISNSIRLDNYVNYAKDSASKSKNSYILKFNPVQIILSEFPVSFERINFKNSGLQFQLGYIFPKSKDSRARQLFENMGDNGTATDEGLLSYRQSPFNSSGFSLKIELRTYKLNNYVGMQMLYKNTFYKKSVFPVFMGTVTNDVTESKTSNIFGTGFVFGHQYYEDVFVVDWYGTIGFRIRSMNVRTIMIDYSGPQKSYFPNSLDNYMSVYPYINMGIRLGIKLN
jgi:hypothetical protein